LKATLYVCGETVVGQALALLLRGPEYTVRFLLARSFEDDPRVLRDARLLVLAPTPDLRPEHRNALVRSLKEVAEERNLPVLELVTPFEAAGRRQEPESESWHKVPWPCRIEELEHQVVAALTRHYKPSSAAMST
jgi:hypothetical protein